MANRRRGNPSNNQRPDGLAQYALNIIRERYTDFGPTLACVKLEELHDVHLSKETIRSLMVKAGPRKQRAPKIQQPRYRRACCGELMQMHELNIQTICANTSSAKGRVERVHLTLQGSTLRSGITRMAGKNSG